MSLRICLPILVVLAVACSIATPAAAERHAVFRSLDRGRSWSRSDGGLTGDSRINAFRALDNVILAGTDSGVFVSHDDGQNWQPTASGAGRTLSFAALGQNLFAGTDRDGIIVSSDKGQTWTPLPRSPSKKVRSLLAHEGRLYAGTDAEGVFLSKDSGQSWDHLDQGLPARAQIFALASVNGRLFAGLYSQGLYAWNDQEHRWNKSGRVTPLALAAVGNTLVAGHNPGGIYWSDDLGATWSRATADRGGELVPTSPDQPGELAPDAPVWTLSSNDDLVFAGASTGIYYSQDRGRTWTRARTGLPAKSPGVAFLVKNDLVLAGTLIEEEEHREP